MPHLIIEYSANLEPEIQIRQLVDTLHAAAIATGVFPVFDALTAYLKPIQDCTPLAISAEMQEIDPQFSYKKNNLHERLARRAKE